MGKQYRAWAEIDLDAISHNVCEIKKHIKRDTMIMGSVKANAYGHGVCPVAEELIRNGVDSLAVAFVDEAVELRKNGFDVPILILGNSCLSDVDDIVQYDIMAEVSDFAFAEEISRAAVKAEKKAKIHIKIDTGMSRIGFVAENETTVDEILRISKLPGIETEGIFTHFAVADEDDASFTVKQFERFMMVVETLEKQGLSIPVKHVCNSAALVKFPQMHLDMVRVGILLYGLYPSREFDKNLINLKPAMTFKSRITQIKDRKAGDTLSYGRTFKLEDDSKIATISVGYADGYPRGLSGRTFVQIGGERVKQVGRICMDQCMIDISSVNNINVGDKVTLFGGTEDGISAESVAEILDTIGYELICCVGRRVPRIYIKDGKEIGLA